MVGLSGAAVDTSASFDKLKIGAASIEGEILGKEVIQIDKNETLETLKVKIHEAEHRLLPKIVEKTILN